MVIQIVEMLIFNMAPSIEDDVVVWYDVAIQQFQRIF